MPAVHAVIKRRTLAAVGLALLALAATAPGFAAGQVAAAGGTPSAPEGPFAANFTFSDPPPPAPSEAFQTLDGAPAALGDFRGKVVLVNFWATWCAPCVKEMPSLERLHLQLAEEGLAVLAVSQDRNGAAVVTPFLGRIDLQHLPVYLDPKGALGRAFGVGGLPTTAGGLPTTYVIGRDGRVLAALVGPAEWDSPEAVALLRHYLAQEAGAPDTPG
ncbi:MAG: TlpA family protein disulfide reductase [Bacteroidota bacterium]|nr:TlpA disulfide reductase family protein [Kiloniellaceae bacterium]